MRSMLFDEINNSYVDTNVSMEAMTLEVNQFFREVVNISKEFATVSIALNELNNFHELVSIEKNSKYAKKAVAISMESAFRRNHIPLHISLETEEDQRGFFRRIYDWIMEKIRAIKEWIVRTYEMGKLKVFELLVKAKIIKLRKSIDQAATRITENKENKTDTKDTNIENKENKTDTKDTNIENKENKTGFKPYSVKIDAKIPEPVSTIPEKTKEDLIIEKLNELSKKDDPSLSNEIFKFYIYKKDGSKLFPIESFVNGEDIFRINVTMHQMDFDTSGCNSLYESNDTVDPNIFKFINEQSQRVPTETFCCDKNVFIPNETLLISIPERIKLTYKEQEADFAYLKTRNININNRDDSQFIIPDRSKKEIKENNIKNLEYIIKNKDSFDKLSGILSEDIEVAVKQIKYHIDDSEKRMEKYKKNNSVLEKAYSSPSNDGNDDKKALIKIKRDAYTALIKKIECELISLGLLNTVCQKHMKHAVDIIDGYTAIFNKLN